MKFVWREPISNAWSRLESFEQGIHGFGRGSCICARNQIPRGYHNVAHILHTGSRELHSMINTDIGAVYMSIVFTGMNGESTDFLTPLLHTGGF